MKQKKKPVCPCRDGSFLCMHCGCHELVLHCFCYARGEEASTRHISAKHDTFDAACAQGDLAFLFIASATDKQWSRSAPKLRKVVETFRA